jgi:hypothetical protein
MHIALYILYKLHLVLYKTIHCSFTVTINIAIMKKIITAIILIMGLATNSQAQQIFTYGGEKTYQVQGNLINELKNYALNGTATSIERQYMATTKDSIIFTQVFLNMDGSHSSIKVSSLAKKAIKPEDFLERSEAKINGESYKVLKLNGDLDAVATSNLSFDELEILLPSSYIEFYFTPADEALIDKLSEQITTWLK